MKFQGLAEFAKKIHQRGIECNNAVNSMLEFSDKSIDIFVLRSFVNMMKPVGLLGTIAQKDGGVIFIKVPNFNSINRLYRKEKWCGFRHPDHVSAFLPRHWLKLVKKQAVEIKMGVLISRLLAIACMPT